MNHDPLMRKRTYLTSDLVLRYLINEDEELDTLIFCNPESQELATTDQNIYEALASVQPYDNFKLNKLAKLFEVVSVQAAPKQVLTHQRVEQLREAALRKNPGGDIQCPK